MEPGNVSTCLLTNNESKFKFVDLRSPNDTDGSYLEHEPAIAIFLLVFIAIFSLVGLMGNILVIGAVCVHRQLRTTGNVFIVNLALADLIVITVVQPFNVVGIMYGEEFFMENEAICHVLATLCVMSCACSMMTLATIALNRYIFVCKNMYYDRIYKTFTTPLMCLCLWIAASLIDLPNYLGWGNHTFDKKLLLCTFDRLSSLSYVVFLCVVMYRIPFFLVCFCYYSIYKFVKKNKQELQKTFSRMSGSNNDALINTRRQETIRMIRTFFVVIVVFLICWAPYDILILSDRNDIGPTSLYIAALVFGHTNSSLNCILYAATNRRFRKGYLKCLYLLNICTKSKFNDYFNSAKIPPNSLKNGSISENNSSGNVQQYTLNKSSENLNIKTGEPDLLRFNYRF